tara:strand:+ start:284 stop:2167 length:1884 start_codon:yes stop_codon:yes gene_type:complete
MAEPLKAKGAIQRINNFRSRESSGLNISPAPSKRLELFRGELTKRQLDGFLVPLADQHQSEFPTARFQRLGWLTGFYGSAGLAIVLSDIAAIFVDGRYILQVREQVDTEIFTPVHIGELHPDIWLEEHISDGAIIGFDPWVHTPIGLKRYREMCEKNGSQLVPVQTNPVDSIWKEQPPMPLGPIVIHPRRYAGIPSITKVRSISQGLSDKNADVVVCCGLDSIAWLLNVRGSDIPHIPVALSNLILYSSGAVEWYVDNRKLLKKTLKYLPEQVVIKSPEMFSEALKQIGIEGKTVLLDLRIIPEAVRILLDDAGARIVNGNDPCSLPKAKKNIVEIKGAKSAHIRDGVALVSFLAWLSKSSADRGVTEIAAARKLYEYRAANPQFQGSSFNTISAAGPNGAIVHYHASPETDRALCAGELYLVDSGAQYFDGTTDVTRTVLIGETCGSATEKMKRYFTAVLKGHIGLAMAVFPKGTMGYQIDAIARAPLWKAGIDYDHGTGHGVGSYLGVHEGPQRISKQNGGVPLESGMIVSNEPGYYANGEYGIRIENLVLVTETENPKCTNKNRMFEFETLTLAPIDRKLVLPEYLTEDEMLWLNKYHSRVRDILTPLVDKEVGAWLAEATLPI